MSQKFMNGGSAVIAAGLLLWVSGCSKEKEESAAPSAPATEPVPAVTMKEPEPAAATPAAPAEPAAKTAPAPAASGDAVVVRARFDGYAARVSKNLWQPVPLTAQVANFALLVPQEALPAGSGLVEEGGPESLAVGTVSGMIKTTEGRPLVAGQSYRFSFRKSGDLWSVEVTHAP